MGQSRRLIPQLLSRARFRAFCTSSHDHGFTKTMEVCVNNGTATVLQHSNGHKVISVFQDHPDQNCFGISFRTPPDHSTGAAHMIEHSILCGSEKFQVPRPVEELRKCSVHSEISAVTKKDKTQYTCQAYDAKELQKHMEMLMDAAFAPRCLQDSLIFQQEGWRYEIEDASKPLCLTGVVQNEMQMYYSSPTHLLRVAIQKALFRDSIYRHCHGGDPDEMTVLTNERLKAYYLKHYHPSNSRSCFVGVRDLNQYLLLLDDVFSRCVETLALTDSLLPQKLVDEPLHISVKYHVGEYGDMRGRHIMSINWLLGEAPFDHATTIWLYVIQYLMDKKISKCPYLCGKGSGSKITVMFDDTCAQPQFQVEARWICESNVESLNTLFWSVVVSLANGEISHIDVEYALGLTKSTFRSKLNTSGMCITSAILDNFTNDMDPLKDFKYANHFESVENDIQSGIWKERVCFLVKCLLLDNKHRVTAILEPSPTEFPIRNMEILKSNMPSNEIRKCVDVYQDLKDKVEMLEPQGEVFDSPDIYIPEPYILYQKVVDIDGVPVVQHFNQISYMVEVAFDISNVEPDLLPLLDYLLYYNKEVEYVTTSSKCFLLINCDLEGYAFDSVFRYIKKVRLQCARATDAEIINWALLSVRAIEGSLYRDSYSILKSRVLSKFGIGERIMDRISGISALEWLKRLLRKAEENPKAVISSLERLVRTIFSKKAITIHISGNSHTILYFEKQIQTFLESLPSFLPPVIEFPLREIENEAFILPSRVNSVHLAFDLYSTADALNGIGLVASQILDEWVWKQIRELGGAYEVASMFDPVDGKLHLQSSADPNLLKTIDKFNQSSLFLQNLEMSSTVLKKHIFCTMKNTVRDEPGELFRIYLKGRRREEVELLSHMIRDASLEEIRHFGELMFDARSAVVVLSSKNAFENAVAERPDFFGRHLRVLEA